MADFVVQFYKAIINFDLDALCIGWHFIHNLAGFGKVRGQLLEQRALLFGGNMHHYLKVRRRLECTFLIID